ncbi:MAG TPA: lactate racemase domain-containing protein, partial [Anaerolineaceae bacterium]|nr:lactate racemase domain-containing protein [Anaerolineaceae bacterium]
MTPIDSQVIASSGILSPDSVRETLEKGLAGKFSGLNVLILIPDHTRSLPLAYLFCTLAEILKDAKNLTFMVALGTHPALTEEKLNHLVGIAANERKTKYQQVNILNHAWDDPTALTSLGIMDQDEIRAIAGERWHPSLP